MTSKLNFKKLIFKLFLSKKSSSIIGYIYLPVILDKKFLNFIFLIYNNLTFLSLNNYTNIIILILKLVKRKKKKKREN